MRKLITALAATGAMLIAGSIAWKAEAATVTGVGSLSPLTKTYSPVENVYYRHYRHYGYGYRPYGYGYGYRPYGYGYGYRPYGYGYGGYGHGYGGYGHGYGYRYRY